MAKPGVFISSSVEGLAIAEELARQLETTATVTLWSKGVFQPGKHIVESLTEVAERSDFAVFVLTADSESTTSTSPRSLRPNVVFELGFLAGHLGLSRTFVIVGDPKPTLPSDLAGVTYLSLSMSDTVDLRTAIAPVAVGIRRMMADFDTRQDRRPSFEYFISYAWEDQDFAVRLHDDLKAVGVRSWLDAKEIKIGARWREQIDRALQAQDKVLLIVSKASISKPWMWLEAESALRLERERRKTVLFPIRVDDAIFDVSVSEKVDLLKEKQIGDFSHWQDKRLYQRAFSQLVRDLTISASVEFGDALLMRRNLELYAPCQVFLNYPFDEQFTPLADAMAFAVVAGGLLPVCAYDLTTPDRSRLEMLVEAIRCCRYSAHDFSRSEGGGPHNFARMNMPIEMGMALFHALHTQRREHRCLFFVPTAHDYKAFASDLAGLDPRVHNNDDTRILQEMYEWLRGVVPSALFNSQPTIEVLDKFVVFKRKKESVKGGGPGGRPSHEEAREVMYQLCAEAGWWDWRGNRMGKDEFPTIPLAFSK